MKTGLSIEPCYYEHARGLVRCAKAEGRPAGWNGRGCEAAGLMPGTAVDEYELGLLVRQFGAVEVSGDLGDPDGRSRDEQRAAITRMTAMVIGSMERAGRSLCGREFGDRWVVASVYEPYDCHTEQWNPHTHNIVITGTPDEIAAFLATARGAARQA
jgi:hypothetical protein